MSITPKVRTVYMTADGTEYLTKAEAESHEFNVAIRKFCERHMYFGMSTDDAAGIIIEQRADLARIFEDFQ